MQTEATLVKNQQNETTVPVQLKILDARLGTTFPLPRYETRLPG
jgi:hypothetical protein